MKVTVEEKVRRLKNLEREANRDYLTYLYWFESLEGEKDYKGFNLAIEGLIESIKKIQEDIDFMRSKEILRQP